MSGLLSLIWCLENLFMLDGYLSAMLDFCGSFLLVVMRRHNSYSICQNYGMWFLFCCLVMEDLIVILQGQVTGTGVIIWLPHRTWWRHQMETFSTSVVLCAGNSPVTNEFPSQRPVPWSFDVFLICAWINSWVNSHEAGGLRCHRAHNDVIVMPV